VGGTVTTCPGEGSPVAEQKKKKTRRKKKVVFSIKRGKGKEFPLKRGKGPYHRKETKPLRFPLKEKKTGRPDTFAETKEKGKGGDGKSPGDFTKRAPSSQRNRDNVYQPTPYAKGRILPTGKRPPDPAKKSLRGWPVSEKKRDPKNTSE